MPTGSFYSPTRDPDSQRDSGGMTGKGPSTQPAPSWGNTGANSWGTPTPSSSGSGGGSGYTTATGGAFDGIQNGALPSGAPVGLYGLPGGTATGPVAGVNPLSSLASLANTLYGPQQQILADTLARQYDQLGLIGANVDYQSDALRRDNALSQQLLGLDRQSLGLDRGLAQGQLGNLGRLREILAQRRGLAGEQKGLNTEEAKDMAGRKQWDLRSDLTQRGAFNTIANERGTGRINRDLDYQLRGIDQQYRNTLLGLTETGIGYDNQQLALQNKLANIGLDSSRLDITEQQLQNALADGLYNIGMGGMTSINNLLDAIGGTNGQQAAVAGQILQTIIGYSGLPPEVIAQINAMLGIGAGSGPSGPTSNQGPGYEL